MADLIAAAQPEWDSRLERVPRDVYHTAGFHRYAAATTGGEAFLAVVGDTRRGLAWPYLARRVSAVDGLGDSGATDIDSVYGYPGPVAWGCEPGDPFLRSAWDELLEIWRSQGAVAVFTRFHPLLRNVELARDFGERRSGPMASMGDAIVAGGATVSIDCALDEDAAVGGYARVLRQEVAQGRRAGLLTEPDEDWGDVDAFVRLYAGTMARNGAAAAYAVSRENALLLRVELGAHVHLLLTRLGDEVVAAGLFTEFEGIVQAHLVGTDERHRRLSPLKVLLDDARRWARERGNRVLHLGGGRGGREDSLFDFKARFSSRRHPFHTGRWILDDATYADLVDRRIRHARDGGFVPGDPSWFPAYRAPFVGLADASTRSPE